MKLEPDLLRDLLLHIEEHATEVHCEMGEISLAGRADKEVTYHVVRAEEAGLIQATIEGLPDDDDPMVTHIDYSVHSLTFRGHELLGAIRTPKHWKVIKEGSKKAGIATVGAIFSFAEAYVKAKAGEYLGLPSSS
ncbi:DUF2513 domain-containing protein [Mesorhizobium sp. A623]